MPTSIIEFSLEVRESPSEVLRRLQNSTIPSDQPSADVAPGRFEVTTIGGTPVEIRADTVSLVRGVETANTITRSVDRNLAVVGKQPL
jgi:hypothetical protein